MNVIDLARDLIAIPSVNPGSQGEQTPDTGETRIGLKIEEILRNCGAVTETWEVLPGRPNVIGFFDFGAEKTLIFDAHLDTVPVEGMTVDPFGGEQRDGRLYGRGACDVKGPAASVLCALYNVSKQVNAGTRARYNALYAGVCDEESGFGGVKSLIEGLPLSSYTEFAGAIVIEPTLLNPIVAHKGVIRWTISTRGRAAHSSAPHLGDNAIYRMAPVLSALADHAKELESRQPHPTLGHPTLSVGVIHGGSAVNIVPDFCAIQVDRRLIPGETPETATVELRQVLSNAGLESGVDISAPIVDAPPMETDPESELVKLALETAAGMGIPSERQYASYCTDASFYPTAIGPVIVIGPGSIEQAHTRDEWISVEQLEAGVKFFTQILL